MNLEEIGECLGEDNTFECPNFDESLSPEFHEALEIVRKGREICSLIPGENFIRLRGHLFTRLFLEGPKIEDFSLKTMEDTEEDKKLTEKILLAKIKLKTQR